MAVRRWYMLWKNGKVNRTRSMSSAAGRRVKVVGLKRVGFALRR
jgi:hypothetical protein